MADPLQILVVEDHEMVRDGIVTVLADEPDLEIAGTARSVSDAIEALAELRLDVVVTDYLLPDGTGGKVASAALDLDPPPAVLMITGADDREAVETALASRCAGFVSKGRGIDELLSAVRSVSRGAAVFPADLLAAITNTDRNGESEVLTARESEVLGLLAAAKNVEEIADELFLSIHTVRNHIRALLAKLGARSQLEAVVLGVRQGLVTIPRYN